MTDEAIDIRIAKLYNWDIYGNAISAKESAKKICEDIVKTRKPADHHLDRRGIRCPKINII